MSTIDDPFEPARLLRVEGDAVPFAAAPRLMAKKEGSPAAGKPDFPKEPERTGVAPDALARDYEEGRSDARALLKDLEPPSLDQLRALDD